MQVKSMFQAFAICGFFTMAPVNNAAAQTVQGIWIRDDGMARMRIAPCAEALCGSLVWLKEPRHDIYNPDKNKRRDSLIGRRVLSGLMPTGQTGEWRGNSYKHEDGRTYSGTIRLSGDRLTIQGCVIKGLVCTSSLWRAIK